MRLSSTVLARAAGHAVVRVLALLGLERLLMGPHLDGVLRALGLYSDDHAECVASDPGRPT